MARRSLAARETDVVARRPAHAQFAKQLSDRRRNNYCVCASDRREKKKKEFFLFNRESIGGRRVDFFSVFANRKSSETFSRSDTYRLFPSRDFRKIINYEFAICIEFRKNVGDEIRQKMRESRFRGDFGRVQIRFRNPCRVMEWKTIPGFRLHPLKRRSDSGRRPGARNRKR